MSPRRELATVIVMPLHPHRPYRSAERVTGEALTLEISGEPAESLEMVLRRLRELARLAAYIEELESTLGTVANGHEIVRKHADASRCLGQMFKRAGGDLQHIARHMPGQIANWEAPPRENVDDDD